MFDDPSRKKMHPKRKRVEVSTWGQPAKGSKGVREFHKKDESKILPHIRMGLNFDSD